MWYVQYVGYVTLNIFLSDQALNSCESDTYDWTKELVVTTGGFSGISEPVAQDLCRREISVDIVDICEPRYNIRAYCLLVKI